MLSSGAFNALLKTLEEPPEHVKFILATTEPQKLPATILSRCQRFDFKKISTEDIEKRLKIICDEIGVQATQEALKIIAVLSEGAMRDSISILERCIQDGENQITEEQIKELVGIPKLTYIKNIAQSIIEYNVEGALNTIEEVIKEGKDINNFLWEIIKYIKDILVYKTSKKLEIYSNDEINQIKELSEKVTKERLLNLIFVLSELEKDMKWSSQQIIIFQAGILKACMKNQTAGLEERIAVLEEKLEKGVIVKSQKTNDVKKEKEEIKPKAEIPKIDIVKETSTNKDKKTVSYWPKIIEKLKATGKIMIYTNLLNTTAKQIDDKLLEIEFNNGITTFGKTVLTKKENIEILTNIINEETGKQMQIKFVDRKNEKKEETAVNDLNNLGININIIE